MEQNFNQTMPLKDFLQLDTHKGSHSFNKMLQTTSTMQSARSQSPFQETYKGCSKDRKKRIPGSMGFQLFNSKLSNEEAHSISLSKIFILDNTLKKYNEELSPRLTPFKLRQPSRQQIKINRQQSVKKENALQVINEIGKNKHKITFAECYRLKCAIGLFFEDLDDKSINQLDKLQIGNSFKLVQLSRDNWKGVHAEDIMSLINELEYVIGKVMRKLKDECILRKEEKINKIKKTKQHMQLNEQVSMMVADMQNKVKQVYQEKLNKTKEKDQEINALKIHIEIVKLEYNDVIERMQTENERVMNEYQVSCIINQQLNKRLQMSEDMNDKKIGIVKDAIDIARDGKNWDLDPKVMKKVNTEDWNLFMEIMVPCIQKLRIIETQSQSQQTLISQLRPLLMKYKHTLDNQINITNDNLQKCISLMNTNQTDKIKLLLNNWKNDKHKQNENAKRIMEEDGEFKSLMSIMESGYPILYRKVIT